MSKADAQPVRPGDDTDPAEVEKFIGRWQKSGGSELANFQTFAGELCDLLGLPRPVPSQRKQRVAEVLQTLAETGGAQQGIDGQDGGSRYFIPR